MSMVGYRSTLQEQSNSYGVVYLSTYLIRHVSCQQKERVNVHSYMYINANCAYLHVHVYVGQLSDNIKENTSSLYSWYRSMENR